MDPTPASLFDAYEQDFQHLSSSIQQKLDVDAKDQIGEQRKATLRRVEIEIDEADDIISQLEVEVQGIPLSVRSPYNARLKNSKATLGRFKKLAKDLHSQSSRSDLLRGAGGGAGRFGASSPSSDDPYGDQRSRLLAGTNTLDSGNRRLADSTRIALETEDVGADILRTLQAQREQIQNSRNTLDRADTAIERSGKTIKSMIRQMYKQRFIIGAIIMVLVVVIILILYFKLVRSR